MKIKIINFKKHNPRRDYETMTWIRLQTKTPFDSKFHGMKPGEMWFWVFLLCVAGLDNNENISVDIEWLSDNSGLKPSEIELVLIKLEEKQLVELADTKSARSNRMSDPTTNITTNYIADDTKFDLDEIYALFPRKEGKTVGMKTLLRTIKTQDQFEKIKLAVKNYAEFCLKTSKEKKFIKHFSTFVNQWTDWAEPDWTNLLGDQARRESDPNEDMKKWCEVK